MRRADLAYNGFSDCLVVSDDELLELGTESETIYPVPGAPNSESETNSESPSASK